MTKYDRRFRTDSRFARVPKFKRGDPPRAAPLERLRQNQEVLLRGIAKIVDINAYDDGVEGQSTSQNRVFEAKILEEFADYIEVEITHDNVTYEVNAAKPFNLRGAIATRNVSGEDQTITPPYTVNDYLLVVLAENGTQPPMLDAQSNSIKHHVIGDARVWAKTYVP